MLYPLSYEGDGIQGTCQRERIRARAYGPVLGPLATDQGAHAEHTCSAGDVALLPHGGAHTLRDAAGNALQVLGPAEYRRIRTAQLVRLGGEGARTTLVIGAFCFRASHRILSLQRLPGCIRVAADVPTASGRLASIIQMLIVESASGEPGSAIVLNRLADILLIHAIRTFIASSDCTQHGLRALADPQIAKALALIHRQPDVSWTVESLAAAVRLSRSGFAAQFSALVGAAPLEYLTRWRMITAAKLLRESDLAMIEVARRAGYQSEASFNRAFKRSEGLTPGAYRRGRTPHHPPAGPQETLATAVAARPDPAGQRLQARSGDGKGTAIAPYVKVDDTLKAKPPPGSAPTIR